MGTPGLPPCFLRLAQAVRPHLRLHLQQRGRETETPPAPERHGNGT